MKKEGKLLFSLLVFTFLLTSFVSASVVGNFWSKLTGSATGEVVGENNYYDNWKHVLRIVPSNETLTHDSNNCPDGFVWRGSFASDAEDDLLFGNVTVGDSFGGQSSGWTVLCSKQGSEEKTFLSVIYDDYNPERYDSEDAAFVCSNYGSHAAGYFKPNLVSPDRAFSGFGIAKVNGVEETRSIASGWMVLCSDTLLLEKAINYKYNSDGITLLEQPSMEDWNSCLDRNDGLGFYPVGAFKPDSVLPNPEVKPYASGVDIDNEYIWNGWFELCDTDDFVWPTDDGNGSGGDDDSMCKSNSDCSPGFFCDVNQECISLNNIFASRCPELIRGQGSYLLPGQRGSRPVECNGLECANQYIPSELVYCDPLNSQYQVTKEVGVSCNNDYECTSNVCVEGLCSDSIQDELQQQGSVLVNIWCFISSPFDENETFEECVSRLSG